MTILVLKPMVLRIPHCKKLPYGALWGVNLANPIIWRGHCLFVFSCYIPKPCWLVMKCGLCGVMLTGVFGIMMITRCPCRSWHSSSHDFLKIETTKKQLRSKETQKSLHISGWWFGTWNLFFHRLGLSWSQLTNSFFRWVVSTTIQIFSFWFCGGISWVSCFQNTTG